MKKSEIAYMASLVIAAPHMDEVWATIFCGAFSLIAIAFDVMECRK